MSIQEKLQKPAPKKLLALDGGGVRSVITIEVLAQIERLAQQAEGGGEEFVLADYFDYIGGTGSGAFLAACLATGMRVDQVRDAFVSLGGVMFDKAFILQRLKHLYSSDRMGDRLKELFGPETTLGSERLRTLLLLVAANAATGSPWPLTNNPQSVYNDPSRPDCTLGLPLWQLVRGSMSSPVLFPPVPVEIGGRTVLLSDGGVSAYNNPALLLALMATLEPYKVEWRADEEHLLLVSVGAGTGVETEASEDGGISANLITALAEIPGALMRSAAIEQDFICRVLGKCLAGEPLDRELGTLIGTRGLAERKFFTYLRYNVELTGAGLLELGVGSVDAAAVRRVDSVEHVPELQLIGRALARDRVKAEHFDGFLGDGAGAGGGGGARAVAPFTTVPERLAVTIQQGQSYEGEDWWNWWVWVDGADDELDRIERVVYTLDRTFPDPIRVVSDRGHKFRLESAGWGVFPIIVTIVRKDGVKEKLVHDLVLRYPDGTPTTR